MNYRSLGYEPSGDSKLPYLALTLNLTKKMLEYTNYTAIGL